MLPITASSLPSFASRTCLITGGSSGIGYSTALLLSSLGCNVLIGDLQPPPPSTPRQIAFLSTDITSYAAVLKLFRHCKAGFGVYPDIVFANAGIGERGDVFSVVSDEEIEVEPNHEVLELDLKAAANTVRLAWWGMKKENVAGSIVLTASVAGYAPQPGLPMYVEPPRRPRCPCSSPPFSADVQRRYNAAKHGVVGLVRSLRYLGPKDNIAVSLVAPAITETAILTTAATSSESVASSLKAAGVPVNTPERVAEVVAYLMGLGQAASGMGLMVQGGEVVDLEKGIAGNRNAWMGERMASMYRSGTGVKGARIFEEAVKVGQKSKL